MRHVPIAEFKDRLSEIVAAAAAGEDITITRHGRGLVRLIAVDEDRMARQRAAIDDLFALGQEIRTRHGPTTREEMLEFIGEGRR